MPIHSAVVLVLSLSRGITGIDLSSISGAELLQAEGILQCHVMQYGAASVAADDDG